jgi:glucan 1,3-beta-glucosidase
VLTVPKAMVSSRRHTISNTCSLPLLGATDDTAALNAIFSKYSGCKIIFFDHGVYYVTGTVRIPAGTQIGTPLLCFIVMFLTPLLLVGEAWPTIIGGGSFFEDINSPQVVVQVGSSGSTGILEISDMIFSTRGTSIMFTYIHPVNEWILSGPAPGAIVVEWNAHDPAGSQAVVGSWNTHIRIGSAQGTNLGSSQCAKNTNTSGNKCYGAFLSLHITSGASAYLEVGPLFALSQFIT